MTDKLTKEDMDQLMKEIDKMYENVPTTWVAHISCEQQLELDKLYKIDPKAADEKFQEYLDEYGGWKIVGHEIHAIYLSRKVRARFRNMKEFEELQQIGDN